MAVGLKMESKTMLRFERRTQFPSDDCAAELFNAISINIQISAKMTSQSFTPKPSTDIFTNDTSIDRRQCNRTVPMKVLALGLGRTGTACELAARSQCNSIKVRTNANDSDTHCIKAAGLRGYLSYDVCICGKSSRCLNVAGRIRC